MPGAWIAESFQVEYKAIIKRKVNLNGIDASDFERANSL
jgi:hypothetical protein